MAHVLQENTDSDDGMCLFHDFWMHSHVINVLQSQGQGVQLENYTAVLAHAHACNVFATLPSF